jgi:23S rRNA pseudouridine1911/1915/1917 synthase
MTNREMFSRFGSSYRQTDFGLVIYAKTSKALSRLTQMVKNREVKKTYWAVVAKEMIPKTQRLVHYLKKNEKNNKAIVFPKATKAQKKQFLRTTLSKL